MVDPTAGRSVGQTLLPWLPVAAWAVLIFALSSQSEPPDPAGLSGRPGWSQAAHFGLYLVLGALLYRAFRGSGFRAADERSPSWSRRPADGRSSPVQSAGNGKRPITNPCALALAAGALYAVSDEVHQYFVPSRQADIVDWLVDVAGVLVGAMAVLALARRRGKL